MSRVAPPPLTAAVPPAVTARWGLYRPPGCPVPAAVAVPDPRHWLAPAAAGWMLEVESQGQVVAVVEMVYGRVAVTNVRPAHLSSDDREAARHVGDALTRYARHGDLRPPTSVWNVRGLTPEQVRGLGVTYLGRVVRRRDGLRAGRVLFPAHPLANPYRLPRKADDEDRRIVVGQYRDWLRAPGHGHLRAAAKALRGCRLGCWCGEWDGVGTPTVVCHCVEVALLAEEV